MNNANAINNKVTRYALLLGMLCLVLVGCTSTQSLKPNVDVAAETYEALGRYKKQYTLVPGDKIEVSVWRVPEVSRNVVVRPDGYISLPTLNDVQAAGLSFSELTEKLTALFSKRLKEPLVTVIALEVREPMIYVVGEVNRQMAVPLRHASTALEAIASAGGAKRSASVSNVSIIRLQEDGVLKALPVLPLEDGQPDPYMVLSVAVLKTDDVVFVPESHRNEVVRFLDDFVNRPLTSVNLLVDTYTNFKLIEQLE